MVLGAPPLAEGSVEGCRRAVKWLPYHRLELRSPLSADDALKAIAAHVEAPTFRWGWPDPGDGRRFEGEAIANGFHIRRVIRYRNSFAPTLKGMITPEHRASRINVVMHLHPIVIGFVIVFLMVTLMIGSVSIMGFAMAIFLYAITMGGFWFEASKQEQALREIFRAT